jgi:hypothetical protein
MTLYHFNHGSKDCEPGTIFGLLPITIAEGSEFATEYDGWKQAFPEGLSVFGYRHMTPEHKFGQVPESKLALEWRCEQVRKRYFGHLRSRYQSFFCLASVEEALAFRTAAQAETGISGSIWELEEHCVHHRGDMRLLTPKCSEANLRAYWERRPYDSDEALWEYLIIPPVRMVRCVEPEA